ncbi:effector-associated domain EAD1-containing protein [Calothrix sp. CCY 0018]|uniref:effector-associated domain EAD1-containing protein n=1 Tax=Calothrix sp. CCY 0018 TaxID=3103864 RepID=UPI0039C69217
MTKLSGEQRKKLRQGLLSAYPSIRKLKIMVHDELNHNLDAIAGGSNLQEVVFNLIITAEAEGWLQDLVSGAIESNPGNSYLKAVAEELGQSTQQQTILILEAIPHGLLLGKEIRKIQSAIERARNRDIFEVKIRTAVLPQVIRTAIAEEQPQIVHFCGHGEKDGSLILEDDGGNNKSVSPSALASLFKLHADYVKCVLLNACHSEKSAQTISQYINYVIGMNNSILDNPAIAFSEGFYDGLGYISNNQDVFQRAFDEGMVAIQMENPSQGSIPVLKKKE